MDWQKCSGIKRSYLDAFRFATQHFSPKVHRP
ncbi:Uncharacterised protein [Shigella dysenteriae]|nr:Uncharacterised protein [Shigella dysenteriae]